MEAQSKSLFISLSILLMAALACQPPIAVTPTPADSAMALTLTSVVGTLSAVMSPTQPVVVSATFPSEGVPSATEMPPILTATPSPVINTPTVAFTASPGIPMASVTLGTNCRTGPGRIYDLRGGAQVGVKYLLIGKSTSTGYWIILLPDGRECWLWGEHAIVEGNVSTLPEYAIPPTPILLGSVSGTITGDTGQPVANAVVTAHFAGRSVTTGSNGSYTLGNLPAGPEFITVEAAAYLSTNRSVQISQGSSVTENFVITQAVPSAPVDGPATLEGWVLISGAPAVGAEVWISQRNQRTVTDNNGYYRFDTRSGTVVILARLGNKRGSVQVSIPPDKTTLAPDIFLLP
jgi:hypothetical protein